MHLLHVRCQVTIGAVATSAHHALELPPLVLLCRLQILNIVRSRLVPEERLPGGEVSRANLADERLLVLRLVRFLVGKVETVNLDEVRLQLVTTCVTLATKVARVWSNHLLLHFTFLKQLLLNYRQLVVISVNPLSVVDEVLLADEPTWAHLAVEGAFV